ncbi:MAG TPA: hypothetical protein DCM59_02640 [Clostridium sp.]|nr:hypothetical protein [Clostridium sp.]
MKLMMHILKSNPSLGINNEKITFYEILDKLKEEYIEVVEAVQNYSKQRTLSTLKEVIRETFDLGQVCILMLWKCHRQSITFDEPKLLQDLNIEHKDKLAARGWIFKTGIEIDVKE